jgi:hypothetical protein
MSRFALAFTIILLIGCSSSPPPVTPLTSDEQLTPELRQLLARNACPTDTQPNADGLTPNPILCETYFLELTPNGETRSRPLAATKLFVTLPTFTDAPMPPLPRAQP